MLTKIVNTLRKAGRSQRGFTLVELMVVIAILGILAAIAIPRFSGATDRADAAKVDGDMNTLMSALEVYRANHGSYPLTLNLTQNASTANNALLAEGLIANVPRPPHATATPHPADWSNNYTYTHTAANGQTNESYTLSVNVPTAVAKYISGGRVSGNSVTYP